MSYGVALRNGIPFTLGTIAALCVNATGQAWSPLALWPTGTEPGMWIDPSNLTSQWQDSAGTTPVSTPGTVADSSNPVGLALDLRLGAPGTLGPELVTNGDFSDGGAGWAVWTNFVDGKAIFDGAVGDLAQDIPVAVGKTYQISWYQSEAAVYYRIGGSGNLGFMTGEGQKTVYVVSPGTSGIVLAQAGMTPGVGYIDNVSVREIPGNHLLQATSTARPLLSAYDGQTLGPGDTYPSTGFPIYQKYDGTDDGMATASFAAGTLSNAMDCMIAVRRDGSALPEIYGLYQADRTRYFGVTSEYSPNGNASVGGCGTPTVWCDGVQLPGGTAVDRGAMNDALTIGSWHILEFRGLDLSAWNSVCFGGYATYCVNGAQGGILLFPSSTSTADRDAARTWLGAKVGLTL